MLPVHHGENAYGIASLDNFKQARDETYATKSQVVQLMHWSWFFASNLSCENPLRMMKYVYFWEVHYELLTIDVTRSPNISRLIQ